MWETKVCVVHKLREVRRGGGGELMIIAAPGHGRRRRWKKKERGENFPGGRPHPGWKRKKKLSFFLVWERIRCCCGLFSSSSLVCVLFLLGG